MLQSIKRIKREAMNLQNKDLLCLILRRYIMGMELIEIKAERGIKTKVITVVSVMKLNSILQWIAQAAANLRTATAYCLQQRI